MIIEFSSCLHTESPKKSVHVSESIPEILLELWQAQCHNSFPKEPVLLHDYPEAEEPFSDIQSVSPLSFPCILSLITRE